MRYGESRTFALLTLLFPFIDFRNHFHVDHVFPQAQFKRPKLRKAELSEDEIDSFQELRDGLANLQLLEGRINEEKQQTMPAEWLSRTYGDGDRRQQHVDRHVLGDVPEDIRDFPEFFDARRVVLEERVTELLGRPNKPSADGE